MNVCKHCGTEPVQNKGEPSMVAALRHFVECAQRPADKALDAQRVTFAKRRRADKIADVVAVVSAIAAAAAAASAVLP